MIQKTFVKPVVVVPVHKALPDEMEIVSLNQCGRCLGGRDIIMLAPEGLDLGHYRELMPVLDDIRVSAHWMESIQAYNRLMISPLVYQAVRGYTHMLIHEPDAIVLGDELNHWCSEPYDYIGAPWFEGYVDPLPEAQVLGVGNFGLSLRRVETALQITASRRRWYPFRQIVKDLIDGVQGDHDLLCKSIRGIGSAGKLREAWRIYTAHCDIFWSRDVMRASPNFYIPAAEVAVHFAWEALPSRCFEMCDGKLPFGIHAWAKYDLPFLLPFLKENGVDLDVKALNMSSYPCIDSKGR